MQVSNLLVNGDMRVDGKIYGISAISTREVVQVSSDEPVNLVKIGTLKMKDSVPDDISPLANINFSIMSDSEDISSPSMATMVIGEEPDNTPMMGSMLFDFGHNSNGEEKMFVESSMDAQLVKLTSYDNYTADVYLAFEETLDSVTVIADVVFNNAFSFTTDTATYLSNPWETGTVVLPATKRVIGGPIPVFEGATESTDGGEGLVPAPVKGDQERFLRVDGTWEPVDFTAFEHVEDSDINALFGDEEITPIYST